MGGRREGEEEKEGRRSKLAGQTLPHETEEGDVNSFVSLGSCQYPYRDSHRGHAS